MVMVFLLSGILVLLYTALICYTFTDTIRVGGNTKGDPHSYLLSGRLTPFFKFKRETHGIEPEKRFLSFEFDNVKLSLVRESDYTEGMDPLFKK